MKKAIAIVASICGISLLLCIGLGIGSAFTLANSAETGELDRSIEAYLDKYGHWFGNHSWGRSNNEVKTQGIDLSLTEQSSLHISANVADVVVKPGDTSRAVLHVYSNIPNNADSYSLNVEQNNTNNITIKLSEPANHHANINVIIEVFVSPKTLAGYDIALKVGDLDIYNLQTATAALHTNVGDISIQNATVTGALQISTSTGDLDLNTLAAKSITAESRIGDLHGNNITADTFSLSTSTGNISAEHINVKETCTLTSQVGDIDLSIPSALGYKLAYSINVGEFNDSITNSTYEGGAKRNGTITVGDGSLQIKASTKTGDIFLHQAA